jgi:hypothetical protein
MTTEPALRNASVGWFPPTPALAEGVRARLPSTPDPRRLRFRRALVVAIALLALVGTAIAASALDLVPGVRINRVDRLPEVSYTWQPKGTQVGLEDARRSVPFTLLLPSGLQRPDRILVDRDLEGAPVVTAIYGGREGASLVLTQWEANDVLFDKLVGHDTSTKFVDVDGAPGIWIERADHVVFYRGRSGEELRFTGYLSGNTLIWNRGSVSYRLEAGVSLERALELARSLRPSE